MRVLDVHTVADTRMVQHVQYVDVDRPTRLLSQTLVEFANGEDTPAAREAADTRFRQLFAELFGLVNNCMTEEQCNRFDARLFVDYKYLEADWNNCLLIIREQFPSLDDCLTPVGVAADGSLDTGNWISEHHKGIALASSDATYRSAASKWFRVKELACKKLTVHREKLQIAIKGRRASIAANKQLAEDIFF